MDSNGPFEITAAMVNNYWDWYYMGGQRIGEPTWEMNCHGYSTGLNYWVECIGYNVVVDNDWDLCHSMDDVDVGCTQDVSGIGGAGSARGSHSIRITRISTIIHHGAPFRFYSQTTEKSGYSGTYRMDYVLAVNVDRMYRKK